MRLTYPRPKATGAYVLDEHPTRKDGDGKAVQLAKAIEALIPGKFVVRCDGDDCHIDIDGSIDAAERAAIDAAVAAQST